MYLIQRSFQEKKKAKAEKNTQIIDIFRLRIYILYILAYLCSIKYAAGGGVRVKVEINSLVKV